MFFRSSRAADRNPPRLQKLLLALAAPLIVAMAACGESSQKAEVAALQSQVASLQRQLSQPTPTPAPVSPTPTPTPEPDRVVGINERCQIRSVSAGVTLEFSGADGAQACHTEWTPPLIRLNWRKEVTIRTAAGTAYEVVIPGDQPVAVGDPWPPSSTPAPKE